MADTSAASPTTDNPYRLPRSVVPERYDLTLEPDLPSSTFTGTVAIGVEVRKSVDEIVLNAAELEIESATVESGGTEVRGSVTLDEEMERATIALDRPIDAGSATLRLSFRGVLNDKLAGFYRSVFRDDQGGERVIATTQMEATDARRAFPCWDEPDLKAVFSVTLVVDQGLAAISNGPVIDERATDDGRRRVTFGDTMPMSTYLVAFIVGPLELTEPVDVDGIPLRVAHVPGKGHMADFALDVGAHALRFFTDYFGIRYPAAKLDLIALPDFAFGAMENLGAVTFRETALLVDRPTASQAELERIADVVSHEIAHMWFGDLVTMRWWNGIWLNEAFATFMELLSVDAYRPDWERWVSFGISRGGALAIDGLTTTRPVEFDVVSPSDAEGMFDVLTYQKGGSVVRMLEQYLGESRFRDGIRRYMQLHEYGNTETTDLWDAIEEVTGEPVRATMDSWIFQGGHPAVSVEADGTGVRLSQRRFLYTADDSDTLWQVPVLLRAGAAAGTSEHRLLLSDRATTVDLGGTPPWVVANAGGSGFYRTRYAPELLEALRAVLFTELTAIERFNLVNDTWAAVLGGLDPVDRFIDLVRAFAPEDDPNVWEAILSPLGLIDRLLGSQHAGVQSFVRELAQPAFQRVGWDAGAGETDKVARLRGVLVGALGGVGADPDVRARAQDLHDAYLRDRASVDPNLVEPVVAVVTRTGGEAEYTAFLDRFRSPETPQEEVRYLYSLAGFRHEGLVRRTLDLALSQEVRTQNAPFVVNAAIGNPVGGRLAWEWTKQHWDTLLERFPDNTHSRMLTSISGLVDPQLARDVRGFLEAHPVRAGQRSVEQYLERLDVNVAFLERERGRLSGLFEG